MSEIYPYQNIVVMQPLILALKKYYLKPGMMLIYRDAFRWKNEDGEVLSNHFEGNSLRSLAEEFGYNIVIDFNHVAIVEKIHCD